MRKLARFIGVHMERAGEALIEWGWRKTLHNFYRNGIAPEDRRG